MIHTHTRHQRSMPSIMKFQLPGPLVTSSFDCPHHHYLLTRPLGTSKCGQNDEYEAFCAITLTFTSVRGNYSYTCKVNTFFECQKEHRGDRGEFTCQLCYIF